MNALSRLTSFFFCFGSWETTDGRISLAFLSPDTYLLACKTVADGWTA